MMQASWTAACLNLCLCLCVAATGVARAQSASALLQRGNAALLRGEPEAALSAYDALAESGIRDPDLEYNRALAHARAGRLGAALLHLERARVLGGGDAQARKAAERVREALGERRAKRQGEATVRTRPPLLEVLAAPLSQNTWAWILWLTVAVGSLMWGVLLHARREGVILAAGVALAIAALGALASGTALGVQAGWFREGQRAVVIEPDLAVRETPNPRAPQVRSLPEGSRVVVLESRGAHARIRAGDSTGWVDAVGVGTF